jgi:hypothetical protein
VSKAEGPKQSLTSAAEFRSLAEARSLHQRFLRSRFGEDRGLYRAQFDQIYEYFRDRYPDDLETRFRELEAQRQEIEKLWAETEDQDEQ